jgi:glycosyltransferase involved in cell wall biosynthesis
MSRLSKENRVFYIESLGLRKPIFGKRDLIRIFNRIVKHFRGCRKINQNLFVYSPLIIPFHGNKIIRRINKLILFFTLKHYLKTYKFNNPVLWAYIPNIIDFVGKFNEKYIVYHCVDEISQFPGVTENIIAMERELLRKADIVFVTSKNLYESKRVYNANTHYLPNVADVAHFSRALNDDIPIPAEMASIQKPLLGFIGAIDDYKVDSDILEYIAGFSWSIVLIGPLGLSDKAEKLKGLVTLKNIYHLGIKDYKELPSYLKYFDVCLIPSRLNDYTKNVFPMKYYEYLAAGKPVVATGIPSLIDQKDIAYIAKDKYEFKELIERALKEDSDPKRKERAAVAAENTWEKRIESMAEVIEKNLISLGKV